MTDDHDAREHNPPDPPQSRQDTDHGSSHSASLPAVPAPPSAHEPPPSAPPPPPHAPAAPSPRGVPTAAPPPRPYVERKSVALAAVLGFVFGPVGMFYSTVVGAIVMFLVASVIGFVTLGFGLVLVWPVCALWSALAASSANARARV